MKLTLDTQFWSDLTFLTEEEAGRLMFALADYMRNGADPGIRKGAVGMVFARMRPRLDRSRHISEVRREAQKKSVDSRRRAKLLRLGDSTLSQPRSQVNCKICKSGVLQTVANGGAVEKAEYEDIPASIERTPGERAEVNANPSQSYTAQGFTTSHEGEYFPDETEPNKDESVKKRKDLQNSDLQTFAKFCKPGEGRITSHSQETSHDAHAHAHARTREEVIPLNNITIQSTRTIDDKERNTLQPILSTKTILDINRNSHQTKQNTRTILDNTHIFDVSTPVTGLQPRARERAVEETEGELHQPVNAAQDAAEAGGVCGKNGDFLKEDLQKNRENASRKPDLAGFAKFWEAYPRKIGKSAAYDAWKQLAPSKETQEALLSAIGKQLQSEQWQKDGGRYIPGPARWLREERWNDALAEEKPAPAKQPVKRERADAFHSFTADDFFARALARSDALAEEILRAEGASA